MSLMKCAALYLNNSSQVFIPQLYSCVVHMYTILFWKKRENPQKQVFCDRLCSISHHMYLLYHYTTCTSWYVVRWWQVVIGMNWGSLIRYLMSSYWSLPACAVMMWGPVFELAAVSNLFSILDISFVMMIMMVSIMHSMSYAVC